VGRIAAETKVGKRPTIVSQVTDSAHVVGFGRLVYAEGHPFFEGFSLFPSIPDKEGG